MTTIDILVVEDQKSDHDTIVGMVRHECHNRGMIAHEDIGQPNQRRFKIHHTQDYLATEKKLEELRQAEARALVIIDLQLYGSLNMDEKIASLAHQLDETTRHWQIIVYSKVVDESLKKRFEGFNLPYLEVISKIRPARRDETIRDSLRRAIHNAMQALLGGATHA